MQAVTVQDAPEGFDWQRFIADGKKDEPPIECRLAVTLSEDAIYCFAEFLGEHRYCRPEHLGWDIRRLHGGPEDMGQDMLATAVAAWGAPEECWTPTPDGSNICEIEPYCARLWKSFDRERVDTDRLLIDGMDEAIQYGWDAPPEVAAEIEKLRDMQSARAAQRKAASKARDEASVARSERYWALDDAGYLAWLNANGPDGSKARVSRWKERCAADAARHEARRKEQERLRDAAQAEWTALGGVATQAQIDAFNSKYANLYIFAEFKPVTIIPFPKSVPAPADLFVSSADFIAGFVPPEYLIDGIVQRRYFYSMTAQTGVGKTSIAMRWMAHVAAGRPIGDREVQEGNVLYLAGENPDDVRARWLVLAREMGINADTRRITWIVGPKDIGQEAVRFQAEAAAKGLEFALCVVDTAAAYNPGDDENSNNQAGNYARQLRSLTNLPGGPCVVVLCHPTKRAGDDDLMPRGGGAFLAEVDGNMAVMRKDSLLAVVPFGKFRGDMSWSQRYEIEIVKDHPKLKDARGRQMRSVLARPVGDGAAAVMEKRTDADMETVLGAVHNTPSATPTDLARILGWIFGPKSEPNVNRVKRNLSRLAKDKLAKETMGKWRITDAGQRELNEIDNAKATSPKPMFPHPLPPLPR